MSHFEQNKKEISEIMNSNISDSTKDYRLIQRYSAHLFKGKEDMKRMTYEWFSKEYPNQCPSFTLLLKLNENQ